MGKFGRNKKERRQSKALREKLRYKRPPRRADHDSKQATRLPDGSHEIKRY